MQPPASSAAACDPPSSPIPDAFDALMSAAKDAQSSEPEPEQCEVEEEPAPMPSTPPLRRRRLSRVERTQMRLARLNYKENALNRQFIASALISAALFYIIAPSFKCWLAGHDHHH